MVSRRAGGPVFCRGLCDGIEARVGVPEGLFARLCDLALCIAGFHRLLRVGRLVFIEGFRVLVPTEWNIKFAFPVHSEQTVVTFPIEKNYLSGSFKPLGTEFFEIYLRVFSVERVSNIVIEIFSSYLVQGEIIVLKNC